MRVEASDIDSEIVTGEGNLIGVKISTVERHKLINIHKATKTSYCFITGTNRVKN